MIAIDRVAVYNIVGAVYSARNAMNSWKKSDSNWETNTLGKNDLELAMKLTKAGSDHSKFMRMINVTCDITAPLYWWKEYDTYKVGTVANSCSTMHKIHAKEFVTEDFSVERLYTPLADFAVTAVLDALNNARDKFLETKDKHYWDEMIQLLPSSYNQKRTVQLNYAVLRNMYHARKNHKLEEWRGFCKWVETLPYPELIVGGQDE